jgi:Mrp family chromosome partitioning ATPase/capsular polysaccharide biosynthesis protein
MQDADPLARPEPRSADALRSYLRAVRAHRLLVAAVVVATLLGGMAWMEVRAPRYTATAQLLMNPVSADDPTLTGLPVIRDANDPTRTAQTAAILVRSPGAARLAAERLGDWTPEQVFDAVDVQPEGQTNILDVSARASSAGAAAAVANAFATAALDERDTAARREAQPLLDRLTRARATRTPDAELDRQIAILEEVRGRGDPTLQLAGRAAPAGSQEGASTSMIVVLALLAGLILGSGAAVLLELLGPRRIRAEEELAAIHPVPILARIPKMTRGWLRRRRASPLATPPAALAGFRSLQLQLDMQDGDHRTVLFTSPSLGDGKTTCVIDFALELAASGNDVILFDLDVRQPELARRLGLVTDTDIRAALVPGGRLTDALVVVPGVPLVRVVPGIAFADGGTLENVGRRLSHLLSEALSMADYVLIDTSPLGEVGDALRFLRSTDDVVLVARLDHTRLTAVEALRDLLRRANKPPTGYVLVGDSGTHPAAEYGQYALPPRVPSA